MESNEAHDSLQARANLLAGLLRLGHEAFDQPDLPGLISHIVNNSRLISRYDRCCVIEKKGRKARILGISGQSTVNPQSEYAQLAISLAASLPTLDKPQGYTIKENGEELGPEAREGLAGLCPDGRVFSISLPLPQKSPGNFLWLIEFFSDCAPAEGNTLALLARHYGQALALFTRPERENRVLGGPWRSWSLRRKMLLVAIPLLLSLFLVKIPITTLAECELIPATRHPAYAPISGIIDRALLQDGARVEAKDGVISYQRQEILFNMAEAVRSRQEIEAELDLQRQRSFASPQELGQVKLLEARRLRTLVAEEKQQWILDHTEISAGLDGVLRINEPETFTGRAVNIGEKLFEVIDPSSLLLKILVPESEGTIIPQLQENLSFFLHTRPEQRLKARIVSVAPQPLPTDEGRICYLLKAEPEQRPDLINGLRGMARLQGNKVMLINYLGRNLILWWRKI
ncbi:MAG: HlyD family efflux transporter periplasmic adaptor subunit [Pseudomonadota bacterium]